MNDHLIPNSRRPVVISDDRIAAGARTTQVRHDDPEVLLRQYLRLIRRVRNQRQGRDIALRRADIETLAGHLGWTDDQVLARLADLMGATILQRATMLAVLATGASLITIIAPSSPAAADHGRDEMPIVVVHDELPSSSPTTSRASRHAPIVEPSMPHSRRSSFDASEGARGLGGRALDESAADLQPRHGDAATSGVASADGPAGSTASGPATDDDGNTVAVGQPPVPPEPSSAASTEASPPATDGGGNTVAVGQPPVPPATGVDDDGNTVAVGLPPVPPTPPAP